MGLLIRTIILLAFSVQAWAAAGLSVQGRLLKPDGTPVVASSVQFRVQLRSPGAENCLMFEETHTKDMSASDGLFTLNVGTGTRVSSSVDGGYSLTRIFANRGTMDFSGTAPAACASGSTYSPAADDQRKLVYQFDDGGGWQTVPTMSISYAPSAIEALQVGGFQTSNLIRAVDGSGNPAMGLALNSTQVTELSALLGGSSTQYLTSSTTFSGDMSGDYNSTSVDKIKGVAVSSTAPSSGQVLKYNGTSWAPAADDTSGTSTDASYTAKGVVQINAKRR